ncbi:MAG: hypothetical protein CEE40_05780 [Chloroflexi bacterium B3_Chlor]|nr:MAG: hypothetical protein CEE40_05780 [Chloroflexi bacterium B3_Chlor]
MGLAISENTSASIGSVEPAADPVLSIGTSGSIIYATGTLIYSPLQIDPGVYVAEEEQQKLRIRPYPFWAHATASLMGEIHPETTYPNPVMDPSVRPLLTETVSGLLRTLLLLLEMHAYQSGVVVTRVEVRRFIDPDDDSEEIVVTQWVVLAPETALRYWDRLGGKIERWAGLLVGELANVLFQQIVVRVRWETGVRPF